MMVLEKEKAVPSLVKLGELMLGACKRNCQVKRKLNVPPSCLSQTYLHFKKQRQKKGIVWVARRLVAAGGGAAVEQV